jgi:hypothetical protein
MSRPLLIGRPAVFEVKNSVIGLSIRLYCRPQASKENIAANQLHHR